MDPVLERSKSLKQPKLITSFLKNANAKLGKAMSKLILHEALPARITESPFLQLVRQVSAKVGKLVRGLSAYEVTRVYLEEEYKEIQECPRGTIFKKSIDASSVTSRTVEYYFNITDKMVDEIGEEFIVQFVTNNEVTIKTIDYMKSYTQGRELLQPGTTRFVTNFIALESIVRSKQALKEMVTSSEWRRSIYARKPARLDMMEVINSSKFWKKAVDVLKIQESLVKVLRMCDGDEKPIMSFIYEAMDRAKLAIQRNYLYYKKYWEIIDRR
ncbi:hypothetical protein CXB51_028500 [Gossypium anomalum]|uniref:DUF659 domain-containing protein n=1 Tax=Gossypium anomalum TaxID=47600 RepID=A0A8J6CSR9_9ROSI|nr:hypothetical protein CXB51_028500 [Gossypium anomalum]